MAEDIDWAIQNLGDAKEGSIEYIIYQKLISQKIPCCLADYLFKMGDRKNLLSINLDRAFIIHGVPLMSFLQMFNSIFRKDIFISNRAFLSGFVVHYLSKSINKRSKKEFNRHCLNFLENGLNFRVLKEGYRMFDLYFPRVRTIFRSPAEYIKYYTLVSNVEMKNFAFVYLFYISWSLILLVFALHKLITEKMSEPRAACKKMFSFEF